MTKTRDSKDDINDYSHAVFRGMKTGAKDLINTVMHPLDEFIYPISELVYDATIITAAQVYKLPAEFLAKDADFGLMKRLIQKNSNIYNDAHKRMQQRIDNMKALGSEFYNADTVKKVEMMSTMATTVWVPGYFIKGVKAASNVNKFGTPFNPPKFHNNDISDLMIPVPKIKPLSISEVRALNDANLLYVIKSDGKLLLADEMIPSHLRTNNMYSYLAHPELANLEKVTAAGTARVHFGKFKFIDNSSGHYLPDGKHLKNIVETVFARHGYREAFGKFNYHLPPKRFNGPTQIKTHEKIGFAPSIPGVISGTWIGLDNEHVDKLSFPSFINEAKACPLETEAMRYTQSFSSSKDKKSCPADGLQRLSLDPNYFDEIYKKMVKNQAATAREIEQVKQLLHVYGVNQIEFNQEVLKELAPIASYINQQMEHTKRVQALEENLAIFRGVHDAFGVIGHIAKRQGEPEIMKAAAFGQHTVGMITNVGKITGSFGFSAVKGLALLEPASALTMIGFSAYDLITSNDEEANDQGKAIQEQIQKFWEYIDLRFDRMEDLVTSGFTHLSKQIKNVYESIMLAVHYTHLDLDIKIGDIIKELGAHSSDTVNFNLAHFTQALDEIEAFDKIKGKLVGKKLDAALEKLESYLLVISPGWPLTFAPSAAVERKPTEIAFNSENVQNRLGNKDLFNRLGYLYEYKNHLLREKTKKRMLVANPYIWLRSMYSYLRLIRQNLASNDLTQLPQKINDILIKPAKADMKFFQDVRAVEFIQKLFSNLETSYKNVVTYVKNTFEQKRLNTTVIMDETLKGYENKFFKDRTHGKNDLTPLVKELQAKNYKVNAEFLYAEEKEWGSVRIAGSDAQAGPPFPFNLFYMDASNKQYDMKTQYEKRIQIFSIKANFPPRPNPGLVTVTNKWMMFPYLSVYIDATPTSFTCELNSFDDYRKQLRARIEDELVIQPRKELARNLTDHTHPEGKKYKELIDLLNKDYLTLQAFLSISGLDLKSSEAKATLVIGNENLTLENPFYSSMPVQTALQAVANTGQLASLQFFFEEKLSANFVAYQNAFIEQAKAAAKNKDFTSANPIELQLKSAISLFENMKKLIYSSQIPYEQQAAFKAPLPKKDADHKEEPMTSSIESSEEKACELQHVAKLATEKEKSQLDVALSCSDHRARNMLVVQLVKSGVYHSDNSQEVIRIVRGYLDHYKDNLLQRNYENLLMLTQDHHNQPKIKKTEAASTRDDESIKDKPADVKEEDIEKEDIIDLDQDQVTKLKKDHPLQRSSATTRASVDWFAPISNLAGWVVASSQKRVSTGFNLFRKAYHSLSGATASAPAQATANLLAQTNYTSDTKPSIESEKPSGREARTLSNLGINDYLGVVAPTILHYVPTAPWNMDYELNEKDIVSLNQQLKKAQELKNDFENTRAFKYGLKNTLVNDTEIRIKKTIQLIKEALKNKKISSHIKTCIEDNIPSDMSPGIIATNLTKMRKLNKSLKRALIKENRSRKISTCHSALFRPCGDIPFIDQIKPTITASNHSLTPGDGQNLLLTNRR